MIVNISKRPVLVFIDATDLVGLSAVHDGSEIRNKNTALVRSIVKGFTHYTTCKDLAEVSCIH